VRCFNALSFGLTPPTPPPPTIKPRRSRRRWKMRGAPPPPVIKPPNAAATSMGASLMAFFRAPLNTEESRCTNRRDAGVTRGRCQSFFIPTFPVSRFLQSVALHQHRLNTQHCIYMSLQKLLRLWNCAQHAHVEHGGWIRVTLEICRTVLWVCGASSRLNTSSSTASMLAVVCAVLDLPFPDFLVIDPVCFIRLIKSFNVLFFHPLAWNSFVSLTAS